VLRLLGRKRRPTAIVSGSDVLAAVVVNAAKSLGLRVGQDLAVTGFDGGFVQRMTEPVLTSVRIPVDRIAAELISCCLREIDEGPTAAVGVLVPTEIAVGGSA
jgi:DNA-binding LacI/PurR family transcriptional regulator